ncbi:MAG: prepilin-type N-terminal cleavage/methylation domain-containing protein [Methylotenera sp.]|uniref:type II secretion system protein n=1 Tax=Methylotenera sp. TaxID=2051956 RepID=UPI002731ECE3|nr:prepilin-type N-terminal cleavage/methylation domain-containing protein [Methylotenera sp.]MDP1523932.1 prepilin-type N-terminal cleavage/methylation domain-containing protein [Methylotenera sp.]MDZ4213058.1 prepilin-type N-terminal cleavage/methylation domain-containing protein [Methylotenera sp.]
MYLTIKKPIKLIQKGFTLVELLIVVIILAILAAIVIPQFSSATVDAQEAALDSNLNALRSAIDLYRVQHNGKFPGAVAATGATCSVGSAGTGAINTQQAVIDQLTQYSNAAGATCSGAATQTTLGPYLRKGFPADPITNSAAIAVATAGTALAPTAATGGWAYDVKTGQIVMNSNATDSKSAAYFTH